jgi:hypothetical protein
MENVGATTGHPYSREIRVDNDGGESARAAGSEVGSGDAQDAGATLRVQSLAVTPAGVHVRFNQIFDSAALSSQSADPSFTLKRGQVLVKGHFVIDGDGHGFTFVVEDGLTEGDYSVQLKSGAKGFAKPTGEALDGDANGIAGGDYHRHFRVTAPIGGLLMLTGLPLLCAPARTRAQGLKTPGADHERR